MITQTQPFPQANNLKQNSHLIEYETPGKTTPPPNLLERDYEHNKNRPQKQTMKASILDETPPE